MCHYTPLELLLHQLNHSDSLHYIIFALMNQHFIKWSFFMLSQVCLPGWALFSMCCHPLHHHYASIRHASGMSGPSYPPSSSVASNLSYWNSKISLHRCYMLSLWSARWQIGVIQLLKGAFQTAPKPEFTFRVDSLAYVPYSHISDSGVCPHVPVTDWWCLRSVSTCGWFMAFWMNSGILCTVNPVSFSSGFFGFWSLNRPYRTTFNHKSCVWCVKSDPVTSNCSHS